MIKGLESLGPSSDFSVHYHGPLSGASNCRAPRSSESGIKKHLEIRRPDLYTQKWVELYRQGFNLENLKLSISLCNYPMGTWPSQHVCGFSDWHHYPLLYPNPRTGVIFSSLSFTYSTSHITLSKIILLPPWCAVIHNSETNEGKKCIQMHIHKFRTNFTDI